MSSSFAESPAYIERSLPRHSSHGARKSRSRAGSRASSLDHRLPIIDEDGNTPPPTPPIQPQPHHRPFSRRFLGEPPVYKEGREPPHYSFWDATGPKGEKLSDLRNNAYVASRGGWKRICLIGLIVVICLVALAVGLAVGLHKKHHSPPPSSSPSSSPIPGTGPFPSGSYTLSTYLFTTTTNCTSNPSSWKCEPSVTYATSPTDSLATFNWIITPTSTTTSTPNFTISSTDNPFAINFANAPLSLLDPNTPEERYTFTTTVQKIVFPDINVKCYYNSTQFLANMYTKKQKSYPSSPSSSTTTNPPSSAATAPPAAFTNWNFAIEATQSIGGGVDVPACYEVVNGQVGARVTSGYTVQPAQEFCSCAYRNYQA